MNNDDLQKLFEITENLKTENPLSQKRITLLNKLKKLNFLPAFYELAVIHHKLSSLSPDILVDLELKPYLKKIKWSFKTAFNLLQESKSYIYSKYMLSILYYEGLGTEKNDKLSFELLNECVNEDFLYSYYNLGFMYLHGYGCEQDIKKSFDLFRIGAKKEHDLSILQLGKMYKDGIGTERDFEKALFCLNQASILKIQEADYQMGILLLEEATKKKKLDKDKLNLGLSILETSSDKNYLPSLYELGRYYLLGIFVKKDINKGLEYLYLCANENFEPAIDLINEYEESLNKK